jgi:glycerophosphoryl diester phosphodiesterase
MTSPLPRVIGHRGAATHAPENTLAGLRKAAELGAPWVEFDVRLTADKVAILHHDDTLKRTAGRNAAAATLDYAEIAELDAGAWFGNAFHGERVPTLSDSIALLGELGLGANIEIKPAPGHEAETARIALELVKKEWPSNLPAPLISSFKVESRAASC